MSLLSVLPIMPLYYNGKTKFSPIHVSDIVELIFNLIKYPEKNLVLECVGPEEMTFKKIIQSILISIGKKKTFISNALSFS